MNNEYTYTVNWGFKLREQGLEHSTFHVMTDEATFREDNVKDCLPEDFCDTYLIYSAIDFPKDRLNTVFFDFIFKDFDKENKTFETDATKPLAENKTIILIVLQLAYYMGFKEVYIIGVDLDFNNIKGHAYSETEGEKERQFNQSVKFESGMYEGIAIATKTMIKLGVQVYNASPVGNLNCMPRVKYEELFKTLVGNNG